MAQKRKRQKAGSDKSPSSAGKTKYRFKLIISRDDPWGKPTRPETRRKVFAAAALVRRGEASLSEALQQEHTSLRSFLKFSQLYRRQPDGTLRVTKGDTYARPVNIYIRLRYRDGDIRTVKTRSYKEAQQASRYVVTVGKVPPSALKEFEGITFGREKYPVLTDFAAIKRLAEAGIRIDEFYAEPPGGTL